MSIKFECYMRCLAASFIMYSYGDSVDSIFDDHDVLHEASVIACKEGIIQHKDLVVHFANKEQQKSFIQGYVKKIQKYDPTYIGPTINTSTTTNGGCYIATYIYGAYDCPQVWTLRRYRDNVLANSKIGRLLIKLYNSISPKLIVRFGNKNFFNVFCKKWLDKIVTKLLSHGFQNTQYVDREG